MSIAVVVVTGAVAIAAALIVIVENWIFIAYGCKSRNKIFSTSTSAMLDFESDNNLFNKKFPNW